MLGLQYYQSKFYFYFILVWDTKDNLSYSTYVHASDVIVEPQNLFNLNYLQDIVEQYRHSWNPMTCGILYFFNIKKGFLFTITGLVSLLQHSMICGSFRKDRLTITTTESLLDILFDPFSFYFHITTYLSHTASNGISKFIYCRFYFVDFFSSSFNLNFWKGVV